jgi:hypothetical protein
MSNSIWKMPDVKPNPADEIVFMIGDLPCVGYWFAAADEFLDLSTDNRYAPDEIDRWAIFADLIAQADKAERLQKQLDRAKWWLKEIVENHRYTPITTAEMALKELDDDK